MCSYMRLYYKIVSVAACFWYEWSTECCNLGKTWNLGRNGPHKLAVTIMLKSYHPWSSCRALLLNFSEEGSTNQEDIKSKLQLHFVSELRMWLKTKMHVPLAHLLQALHNTTCNRRGIILPYCHQHLTTNSAMDFFEKEGFTNFFCSQHCPLKQMVSLHVWSSHWAVSVRKLNSVNRVCQHQLTKSSPAASFFLRGSLIK